ncbi:MAG: DNA-directed RNA polymerase subunit beta' [Ruminococcaceae bacterium]|nr:DNA-directed RNA polymerase subunit beta' [Oscillospiraceae bacterium]
MEHIDFDKIKIGLASPDMIRKWSYGEVKKPETINYRTLKPERDGLFCERIFGPTKDWECFCGKYKKVRFVGKVCEKCGVEVTTNKVRRERMGHIELAAPVSHIWYFRAIPSRMGLLLDISPRILERVLYFAQYIVIDPRDTKLAPNQALTEQEYRTACEKYDGDFEAGIGAEAVKKLLQRLDLEELSKSLKQQLPGASGQKKMRIVKRLEVVESFRLSGNKPEWMILDVVPVIPPDIRPMVQLDGGRFATSDLNDLYRRVINRNNRLRKLMELHAPEIIIRNEKRMLQEAVDALIDNGRRGRPVTGPSSRPLKSLSEMLRGKQGRFRQNLLGKRVDYSGRSVIVVGPDLKIYQCGLPKEMALELFKPFVMKRLVETGKATNIKDAKKRVERVNGEVWDALEMVIKDHPVLLNRAPTLHRLSIQAFEPVLVEGRAIKLHPLVCTAFNADFDGDQMPVHVPLSPEAQAEARFLMLSVNNLLKPVNGRAVTVPTQDMVLGSYYLTYERDFVNDTDEKRRPDEDGAGKIFRNMDEAIMAYECHDLGLHARIKIRVSKEREDGEVVTGLVETTLGRMIFNSKIPQNLGFVDRTKPENFLKPEIDFIVTKDELGKIIDRCIKYCGPEVTAEVLDDIKSMGFRYSTKGAITISVSDMTVPKEKPVIIAAAEAEIEKITKLYKLGLFSDEERYKKVIKIWEDATKDVTSALQKNLKKDNPINMMAVSGARGSIKQIRQLAGMRGLMATATGKTLELPIKANFREGLNILEYFIAARGARKGLADTALRTADSGYLTRRLVDVSQEVIIREHDCGSEKGIWVTDIREGNELIESLADRILGRFTVEPIVDPNTGELIIGKNEMITEDEVKRITAAGIEKVCVRSILECKAKYGVCAHCYGSDLASGKTVNIGEAVGIIAAQSIGEPGTQLTMRTFHTGGVAGNDITQGLPRVEELFEARSPKKPAMVAEFDGIVRIDDTKKQRHLILTGNGEGEEKSYTIPYGTHLKVADGDAVIKGQLLTEGVKKPTDIVRVDGLAAAYEYIIKEVQRVYRLQAVEINDKHIEVIARQMTRKVRVENPGSTNLLAGALCDITEFNEENEAVQKRLDAGEAGLALAESSPVLLGITKASLSTESFLSAASFQETTKVLTEAAIKGKIDPLLGLKENVIIGKLIPAGTGMNYYNDVEVEETEKNKEDMPEGKYMDTLDLAEEVKSSYEYDPMEDEGEFEENEFDEADEELSDEDEELYDDDFDDEDEEFPEDEE